MITKERLQELIEQGATIYIIKTEPFIAGYANELKIVPITLNNCYGISTEKYNKKHNCKPRFYYSAFVFEDICDADKVFETKEEAEFILKYHKSKTLHFQPPTFEEFLKTRTEHTFANWDCGDIQILMNDKEDRFYVFYGSDYDAYSYINDEYIDERKEVYCKAVEYAMKLFLGEKV